jgi:hypothetical protein
LTILAAVPDSLTRDVRSNHFPFSEFFRIVSHTVSAISGNAPFGSCSGAVKWAHTLVGCDESTNGAQWDARGPLTVDTRFTRLSIPLSMTGAGRMMDSSKRNEEGCIRRAEGRNGFPQAVAGLPDTIPLN